MRTSSRRPRVICHDLDSGRLIWRFQAKSMADTPTGSARPGWHGLAGDRRFAVRRVGDRSGSRAHRGGPFGDVRPGVHPFGDALMRALLSRPARTTFALLLLVAPSLPAQQPSARVPACREIPAWPRLAPGETLGMVSGVALDPSGHVVVFRRAGRVWGPGALDMTPIARPTVLVLDADSGTVRRAWGAGRFAMPHGLTVDAAGNVWLTDVALHQVYKFGPAGELLLTLGERGVPGRRRAFQHAERRGRRGGRLVLRERRLRQRTRPPLRARRAAAAPVGR